MSAPANRPEQAARRTGRFQPGQSGNPSGRPAAIKVVREMAQRYGEECVEGLMGLARDEAQPGSVRRAAYADVLARAYGLPSQPVDITDARPLAGVPADKIIAALDALAVRVTVAAVAEPDGLSERGS